MNKYTVIDIETTGHSAETDDYIIDIGIVIIENQTIVQEYTTLLKPNKTIPSFITNLTGITDDDVENAPFFSDIAHQVVSFFKDSYLVAHNVPFDLGFLNKTLEQNGFEGLIIPTLDTVELSRIFFPQAPSYKLDQLAKYLDLNHMQPHRALSDAYITAEILIKIIKKISYLPYETISHLLNLEKHLHSNLDVILQKQKDKISFSMHSTNHSFELFNGLAFKKVDTTEKEPKSFTQSYGDFLDDIYEKNGTMEKTLDRYEYRSEQREMSEHIFDAFQSNTHALIEAETGTGKSIAYLLPSIYEALTKNERLIISTYTTQLQSQLLEEDIPFVMKMINHSVRISLLKGKHHYLSLSRFARSLLAENIDNYDVVLTQAIILIWLTETETGDIDEIHLPRGGYFYYQTISTESEGTVDSNSSWFSYSYYQKARERAQHANIIITNHALLCTDIFNDYKLLPSYKKIIIDEAHHFETTAAKHYGLKLDYVTTQYTLNQIGSMGDGKSLHTIIKKYPETTNYFSSAQWKYIFLQTKHEIDELFRALFKYVSVQTRQDKTRSDIGRIQYHLQAMKGDTFWESIKDIARRTISKYDGLIRILNAINKHLEQDTYIYEDLRIHIKTLQSFVEEMERFFFATTVYPQVRWIEIESYGAKNAVYLYSEPTDVSSLLIPDFFNQKDSIVLTSATLTMRNSFSYMAKQFGLDPNEIITEKLTSPFSYTDQVQLLVPNDFPDINEADLDPFIFATCEAIISLADVTKGRMLVLFTSYNMLRKAYSILRETLDVNDFMLIAQGITSGSRSRLKKNFQTFERSILLGTNSFWEGIDIPGEALSSVVIVRLPFSPPSLPIYKAKSAKIQAEGKNPFFELALPRAVIRFKQGFGRLIRSTTDRGIVFICDARIVKSRYGHFFTKSIPEIPLHYDSTYKLIEEARDWF